MATEVTTEMKQEVMEVDGESDQQVVKDNDSKTNDSKANDSKANDSKTNDECPKEEKEGEPKMNGEAKDATEDKPTVKPAGIYKVKVGGLPRFYPLGEFKKLIKQNFGLALSYVHCPKRGSPWLHLTFATPEEQQRALKAIHKYMWRGRTLSCSILTTDAQKRKPEGSTGGDSDAKKAKLDLSVEERVLNVTIPYHNIPYEEQLKKKLKASKVMVVRFGDLVVRRNPDLAGWAEQQKEKNDDVVFKLEEIRPSPVIDGYQNKCEFRIGINPDTQERTVGCPLENYKDGFVGVGPADALKHLPDQMREAVKLFQEYVRKSDKEPFYTASRQGYWRHLVVRVTTTGDMMLVVVIHPRELTDEDLTKMKDDIRDFFVNGEGSACKVTSLYFQKFTEKLESESVPEMEHLHGKTHLEEVMMDLTFRISPLSYFQVNTKAAEVLYSAIIELVEPTEDTTVLDLCCGTGGIALCIAKKCAQVYGIEHLSHYAEDANLNAKQNEITNCEFITGRIEDILPTLNEKISDKTVVAVLHPPRTGATQKMLSELRKLENVQKLVYLCSNHKALIRNLLDLGCSAGKSTMTGNPFVPVKAIPVDLVPHAAQSQMVILLERVDPTKLPKAKNPPKPNQPRKALRNRAGRGGRGRGGRGRGSSMLGMRGAMRGRGMGMGMRNMLPMQQQRMGYRGVPMGPPSMREYNSHPQMRSRNPRDVYMDGFRPSPLMEREYLPPLLPTPGSRPPRRLDYSSDELTLSRYSDFRRDVEDAIDSSFSPRSFGMRRSGGSMGLEDRRLGGNPAVTAAAMLEREEMAYRAGLTRGLVGAAAFGSPPDVYSQYGAMAAGRYKGSVSSNARGGKRGNMNRGFRGRR